MNRFLFLFLCVYLPVLIAYFFSETSGNFKCRAANKPLLAALSMGYPL